MAVGFPLTLQGNVFPTNATNQTIVWSVTGVGATGASITGNSLTATAPGTAQITATIAGGNAPTVDYVQEFNIRVVPADTFFSPLVVDGGSGSGNYHAGEAVTITASPAATGKVFKEWQTTPAVVFNSGTDKYSTTARFAMPASAVAATAMYDNYYAVTVQTDGNGSAVANKTSALAGESIDLTATPHTGYHLKEWQVVSGGVTIVNNAFVMPNNPVTVKAVFEVTSTTPPVTGTTTSGGSSSGEGTTKADVAPVIANRRAFTKTDATKLSTRARNYTSVDKGVLAELAALAEKNGVTLTIHFDTVVSNAVTYRLSVNPAIVQTNLDLTAKIAGGKITLPKFATQPR